MKSLWRWTPMLLFLALVGMVWIGWQWGGKPAPSVWVGHRVPSLTTTPWLSDKVWRSEDMVGKVWVLHAWATWCAACRQEHAWLMQTMRPESGRTPGLSIVGFNYKDPQGTQWLQRAGNPYDVAIADPTGALGIQLGLTALPETFVIDATGTVRFHRSGILTREDWDDELLPMIRSLSDRSR